MYGNVKTVWFAMLQLAKSVKRDHNVINFSTLNEKLSVQSGVPLNAGEIPDVAYLCIGRGGVKNVSGSDTDRNILQHKITDGCLFEQIPFVMRKTTSDLDVDERKRYRLRKLRNFGGTDYFCYYSLKVDLASSVPSVNVIDTTGGKEQIDPFIPNIGQQTPVPVSIDVLTGLPITTTNKSIKIDAPVEILLSSTDIAEILNACEIIYGSPSKAIISEVAFCSGVDRSVTSSAGGLSINYTEVIACQPCAFMGEDLNLLYSSGSYTLRYSLGTTLRLLA